MTNPESEQAAFPMVGTEHNYQADGLTKREYFAGQALTSIPLRAWGDDTGNIPSNILSMWATAALGTADAMLEALNTKHPVSNPTPDAQPHTGSKAFSAKGGEPNREKLRTIGHGHVDGAQKAMIAALAEGRNCLEMGYEAGLEHTSGWKHGADAMLRVAVKCDQEGFAGVLEAQAPEKAESPHPDAENGALAPYQASGEYLIWSNEHGAWWGPGERGYFLEVERAGAYTRDRARQIARNARGGWRPGTAPPEIAVPIADLPDAERDALAERGLT